MPSSRKGGARLDANGASKAGAKTAQRVNSGKYVVPGQTTLGFGREQKSFLKPAAAKQNVAKTVATSSGSGAVAKASAAKTLPETGQGNGAAARASSANTMASTNEGSRGTSSSSSSKGYLDLDALLDGLGESSKCYTYGRTGAGKTHTMRSSSKGADEVEVETAHDLLAQIRSILERFNGVGALASVDARRDAAISDIGLAHDTVANKISELRGLLKANSQLDVLNAECAAVLRGGGVICTHCTENNDVICDERATRTLFIASNGGYPQNSLHGEA